jgi:hypothetical protein
MYCLDVKKKVKRRRKTIAIRRVTKTSEEREKEIRVRKFI